MDIYIYIMGYSGYISISVGLPSAKLGSKNPIGWFLEGCSTGRFIKGRIKCANHSHSRANMLISRRENRRLRTRLGKNGNGSICVSSHI